MTNQVKIFDTTLRDGEQALPASLSVKEKLQIALALERLGVDIIEAGFPVSSPGDFKSVQMIAKEVKNATVAGLSRALPADIDACGEALKVADQFRIHTFIATSDIHVSNKLKKTQEDIVEMAVAAVKHAGRYTNDIEFSCEDAGRTHIDYLCRMVEAVINAGATTVNIPDTVGYTTPTEFGGIIKQLFNRVPNIDKATISVHCHNDLGLAVANSLAAVENGARQVECTINGIGERAGNCSLEEIAMILQTRQAMYDLNTNINSKEISRTSKLVSQLCNMPVQSNKAIVGSNAFSHSSGIHQDGVLKAQNTYEIMTPESVGINKNHLNLTSRSGRHVIKHRLHELGYKESDYDLEAIYAAFLKLADKKGQVYDYDLEALLFFDQQKHDQAYYQLTYLHATSGKEIIPSATVQLKIGDDIVTRSETGNGPVDASYKAIMAMLGHNDLEVVDFKLDSKGEGADALASVSVITEYKGRRFHGIGLATDIVEAGVKALIFVLNNTYLADQIDQQKHQQDRVAGV
ncbi:2-isopropylmalate synthase [Marisediminitalea aggregata]|jgi:2-isopropylmalate synthase|uniref:2-isopropylmalate synthase n=1 Tax=Marisediminitalea aggregata TaxID=634436 RepID=A0A1M5LFZ6_9ALTE|nr:2-isopropylmalate synthase [Marisediminitalea aggregata]MAP21471.1 2-isopropylmalate synthase [Alteromonadaceae bacterium]MCP3864961.1 2-isopropylmalate synthase [Aestuariibacter sp.]MEC7823215.1 2-isopropylmalate synthase [Pseudomonadota bacterium]BBO26767.1 2-isopropylmalate synthase [Alteromonas sp. I4]HBY41500.1 2-isopropylmalate synthase [Alteromonas sp.]|tara:strand:+ start:1010 stop:2569 length:1560 start_codon:yes stop_codon:yes gene_type:complete